MKHKLKEWIKRYLPAEVFDAIGGILGASIAFHFSNNLLIAAYAGTLGDSLFFYSYLLIKDSIDTRKQKKIKKQKYTCKDFLKNIRNLTFEFGPSEPLDTFIVRPFFMFTLPQIIPVYPLAIFLAKIVSDIIFYIPVIILYELRKKILK
jgi:hypothetical protein